MRALRKSSFPAILLALLIGAVPTRVFASPNIRVGVITPLTGTLQSSGESVRDSILLAEEMYDRSDLVQFQFEDDSFLPKNSVTIAKKFIADGVSAIVIFGTPTSAAVVPLTEQAQVPLLAITIVDRVVEGKQFAVRHFVSWQEENARDVEEAKKRGYKSVAIVTTINDAALALRDGFVAAAPAQIALNEEFAKEEMDFRTIATKIKSRQPDAVYTLLFAPQGSTFMKSLRDVGAAMPTFGVHNVEDPSEIKAANGTFEGIWFVTNDDRAGGFYFDAYQKRFGRYPSMGGGNAFDYGKMIIEAAQAGTPVLEFVKNLKGFSGAFGTYGANGRNGFEIKATVKEIKNSEFRSVDSVIR